METYLGVKIIKASKEMSRKEYCDYRGWELPADENGEDRVYLVEYEPEPNSKPNHPDHEGYISMSPKDVFDKAYKKAKTLEDLNIVFTTEEDSFQDRVHTEAEELQGNIVKLKEFIEANKVFTTLPSEEQVRLKQQLMAMQYYLTVLVERIENFK